MNHREKEILKKGEKMLVSAVKEKPKQRTATIRGNEEDHR